MAKATLTRGSTTVELPLITNSSGTPLAIRSIGKPNLNIQPTGAIDPRHIDQWSGNEQYNLLGRFIDSNAYSDAIELADLIKSNSDGTELTLNINMSEFDSDIPVAPSAGQDQAVSISYLPGRRDEVHIDLGLTRIKETIAGSTQPASTPTASGSGPIQITDGTKTVDLVEGVEVTRNIGRPNSVVRRSTDQYPIHIDKHKTAADTFELSLQFTDNTVSQVNDLVDIFNSQLGRDSLTLSFNGLYGLGDFSVVPSGSEALRAVRSSGEQGTNLVPSINLRRVYA